MEYCMGDWGWYYVGLRAALILSSYIEEDNFPFSANDNGD